MILPEAAVSKGTPWPERNFLITAARLAGLAGEIPEKIELALGAAVIKEFLSG